MTILNASVTNGKTIKLSDGRSLGYAICGDPEGKPVFHFHGFPDSRLEVLLFEEAAKKAGIYLIGLDRPGIGLSDFKPNRCILDWPDDVIAFADALGLEKFAVLGLSGGGPYAAACAYKIPEHLRACGILAGLGPRELSTNGMGVSNRLFFFIIQQLPHLLGLVLWVSIGRHRKDEKNAERILSKIIKNIPESDSIILTEAAVKKYLIEIVRESFRQGNLGPTHDGKLYGQPWGFNLEDIDFKKVYLWHGELDINVPISMGRAMAEAIPNCTATYYPNEGHFSIIFNHAQEILKTLVS